jgi:hypothetical protein
MEGFIRILAFSIKPAYCPHKGSYFARFMPLGQNSSPLSATDTGACRPNKKQTAGKESPESQQWGIANRIRRMTAT